MPRSTRIDLGTAARLLAFLGAADPAPQVVRAAKRRNRYRPHQGAGEIARRKAQIERNVLTWANGVREQS